MASLNPNTQVLGHRHAAHLLRRATYNHNKTTIDAFALKTANKAVDELFIPQTLNLSEPIALDTLQAFINSGVEPSSGDNALKRFIGSWWIEEALNDISIGHKLAFFLHSNFVINADSTNPRQFFDYLSLLRFYQFGSFKSLALKIITDNTMLKYLNGKDNTNNSPNENFAREFFELFTIGKGPQIGAGNYTNYTEADIVEAAKLLTGWTTTSRPIGDGTNNGDPQYIDPDTGIQSGRPRLSKHDTSDKVFSSAFNNTIITGATVESDMRRELADFVDMIFAQTATAKNICTKIYRYFVGPKINSEIETDIIEPLAQTLIDNNYDISFPIKELLKSKHFYDLDIDGSNTSSSDQIIGNMIKSPLELLLQTQSFFNISSPNYLTDADNHYTRWYKKTVLELLLLGGAMTIFQPDSVAGYPAYYQVPSYNQNWFNGSTLIARYKLPEILLTGTRVIMSGSNGGVSLNIVDFVDNSGVVSDPYDADSVVNDLTKYLLPEISLSDRALYFKDIFLDDLSPINWWYEWQGYKNTGNDSAVKIPLETLFKAIISSQEYQIM